MQAVSNLGYMVLGVSDLAAWEGFAVNVLGMQVGCRVPGESLGLRMDDYAQRVLLLKSDLDDFMAAGWEFDTWEALNAYLGQIRAKGVALEQASVEVAAQRCVDRLYFCEDPDGIRHEFYCCAQRTTASHVFRSQVLSGAFSTGRLGVGHLVSVPRQSDATLAFCRDVLGLRLSDYITGDAMPGATIEVTFMHAQTGRHHSLALAKVPFPVSKRIHHIMFEVDNPDDVGLAYDRCKKAGVPIMMELGHHPNDRMFSFYMIAPSGFAIEFGCGGIVVDQATWEVKRYTELSDWGHKLNPPPGTASA
ncbi:VOC family protein [Burkholderia cepacia]|nr:VOC family protein [Burkholderia cepacia]HDR9757488.1 VOC family protein [Burkholderia cepacia ATCC 25416]MBY4713213.1 VOC family protein [Burkholderia cepacia]MBY4735486.1 VOC family protein [Burkholderia cepacia]MBY4747443.1 VOC family protein [Burkholderia cepacia]MBY4755906.1 VOC family protein [Burkholderia cepacia]